MDGECQVAATGDLRVKVSRTESYFYPDIVVVCGEPRAEDNVFDTLLNPTLIVEVLSTSTETYDKDEKFTHYRQIDSLQEYILISGAGGADCRESLSCQQNFGHMWFRLCL